MNQQKSRHEHAHNTHNKPKNTLENSDYRIFRTHDKNYTYGHDLGPKNRQTTRIIYTNINGIKDFPKDYSILNLLNTMEETEADILLLSEINIPWNNITVNTVGNYFKRQNIQNFKVIGTSSDEICKTFYLPGGCAILLRGPVVGRIAGTGADARGLGRWCYVKLNGKKGRTTWIIAAYRVQNNPYGGTTTVYSQQKRLLTQQGVINPKPQTIWDNDFQTFLKNIPANDEIIVGLDANASLQNKDFITVMMGKQLQDLISQRHGENTPPTYDRGKTTLDHF